MAFYKDKTEQKINWDRWFWAQETPDPNTSTKKVHAGGPMHAYIQHTFALARVLAHILDVQDQGFLLVSKLDTSDEKSTTKQN